MEHQRKSGKIDDYCPVLETDQSAGGVEQQQLWLLSSSMHIVMLGMKLPSIRILLPLMRWLHHESLLAGHKMTFGLGQGRGTVFTL
jgi:hypothetical protein